MLVATMKITFRFDTSSWNGDDQEEFMKSLEKDIISRSDRDFGLHFVTIQKEFEYESLRDFIFDIEKDIQKFEDDNCGRIEAFEIKSLWFKPNRY